MIDYVTLIIDEDKTRQIENEYYNYQVENGNEYIIFQAKLPNLIVTIYYSEKKGFKALFQGENALEEAKKFDKNAKINEKKEKENISWQYLKDQIGSDEVGTGDFFGPVIVVASFIEESLIEYLKELKVNDSKKLKDQQILKIVPKLLDKVIFSKLTCHNDKYNEQIENKQNMNSIKAILHNQALINVKNKVGKSPMIFIDQFCDEKIYYYYLYGKKEILKDNVVFRTKGESYYPSVAVSSMIARYSFLKEMEVLSQKYGMEFPKGASLSVDEFAKKFVEKFGIDEMRNVCKMNFSNYSKLINK